MHFQFQFKRNRNSAISCSFYLLISLRDAIEFKELASTPSYLSFFFWQSFSLLSEIITKVKKLPEKRALKLAERVAKQLTENLSAKLAEKRAVKVTEKLPSRFAMKLSEKLAVKRAKKLAEKLAVKIAKKLADKIAVKQKQKVSKKLYYLSPFRFSY